MQLHERDPFNFPFYHLPQKYQECSFQETFEDFCEWKRLRSIHLVRKISFPPSWKAQRRWCATIRALWGMRKSVATHVVRIRGCVDRLHLPVHPQTVNSLGLSHFYRYHSCCGSLRDRTPEEVPPLLLLSGRWYPITTWNASVSVFEFPERTISASIARESRRSTLSKRLYRERCRIFVIYERGERDAVVIIANREHRS